MLGGTRELAAGGHKSCTLLKLCTAQRTIVAKKQHQHAPNAHARCAARAYHMPAVCISWYDAYYGMRFAFSRPVPRTYRRARRYTFVWAVGALANTQA